MTELLFDMLSYKNTAGCLLKMFKPILFKATDGLCKECF
jgi:hypothetical protein